MKSENVVPLPTHHLDDAQLLKSRSVYLYHSPPPFFIILT